MTFVPNPFNPSRSLPTFAAIQRRRQELLAYQARQEQAQATAAPGELLVEDQAHPSEESFLFQQQEEDQEEDQEEPQELQPSYSDDLYPGDDSEPSLPPPPRSSAPPTPALADPALYGIAWSRRPQPCPTHRSRPGRRPPPVSGSLRQPRRPRPTLPCRCHASRSQSLRCPRRRIEQGPQRNQLAPDLQPIRRSGPTLVGAPRHHRSPQSE
jgi:hypothetical protein